MYRSLQDFTTAYFNSGNITTLGLSKTVLNFIKANYNIPQVVTVKALEEANENSDVVSIFANSSGLPIQIYNFNVIDNDTRIVISGSPTITEGNLSSMNVYLRGSPGKNRTVRVTSGNPSAIKFGIAEDTATDFIDLELTQQPSQDVIVTFVSGNTSSVTVSILEQEEAGMSHLKTPLSVRLC